VGSDEPTCFQPRTGRQSLKNAVFLPCGQFINFLFAACPNLVPAPCAWLLSTQLVDHDKSAVIGLYYGASLLEGNKSTDNRAQSGVFGKAEVLVDKAKHLLAKCFLQTILPAGPIPHQILSRSEPTFGARRVASQIRAGRVVINNMTDDPQAPWGGFKYSGVGREYGSNGIEAFLETRAILE
jgi:hypothetical protein